MRRASFMDHDRANFFSGPYLERRAEAREDPDWIASARADPATLYLVGHGTAHLLHADSPPRIAFLAHGAPLVRAADEASLVLLGWFRGMRCVLLGLPPGQAVGATASGRCSDASRAGRRGATPPSPVSSSPARAWRTRSSARWRRRPASS